MKKGLIFLFFLCLGIYGYGQSTDEEEKVVEVIRQLFTGMKEGDSSMVRKSFYEQAQLYTVIADQNGDPVLHQGSLNRFIQAVGTPHDEAWNEPIWDIKVNIDGNLAQVWAKYSFYLGNQFSHCGVDAFHLLKDNDGWKIYHLTDTRRKTGCEVPENIRRKYEN